MLVSCSSDVLHAQLALRAVSMSKDLYGNDTMSYFELSTASMQPVDGNLVPAVPDEIIKAELKLSARRSCALILRCKATFEEIINVCNMVEIYNKNGRGRCTVFSTPKVLVSIKHDSQSIFIPEKVRKRRSVAIEDICLALPAGSIASIFQHSVDQIDDFLNDGIDNKNQSESTEPDDIEVPLTVYHDADFSEPKVLLSDARVPDYQRHDAANLIRDETIELFWNNDQTYYTCTVRHLQRQGCTTVVYNCL